MLKEKKVKCSNCGYEFLAENDTRCPRCNSVIYVTLKTCENCKGCLHKDSCSSNDKQISCKK